MITGKGGFVEINGVRLRCVRWEITTRGKKVSRRAQNKMSRLKPMLRIAEARARSAEQKLRETQQVAAAAQEEMGRAQHALSVAKREAAQSAANINLPAFKMRIEEAGPFRYGRDSILGLMIQVDADAIKHGLYGVSRGDPFEMGLYVREYCREMERKMFHALMEKIEGLQPFARQK